MAQEIRDESGHIRYIHEAKIKEAGRTYFIVSNSLFHVENDFEEGDRVRITIERVVDVPPDSDNQGG